MTLRIKKLSPEAILPVLGTSHSAGYDIYSIESGEIQPHSQAMISTGISLRIPHLDHPFLAVYASVRSRSGLSAKHGIEVGAGVIDEDYRGELKVILHNHSDKVFTYNQGDRIAQFILEVRYKPQSIEEITSEDDDGLETDRGVGGFGSTGK